MGYRALLKHYIAQLRKLVGDDYIEEITHSDGLSRREIGELRTIAAELQREALLSESEQDDDDSKS